MQGPEVRAGILENADRNTTTAESSHRQGSSHNAMRRKKVGQHASHREKPGQQAQAGTCNHALNLQI